MIKDRTIKETINIMSGERGKIMLMILFDLLFIILIINTRYIAANFNRMVFSMISYVGGSAKIISLLLLIILLLLFVFIYSFFKYLVVGSIMDLFTKKNKGFNRFFSFFKLNLTVVLPIALILYIYLIIITLYLNKLLTEQPYSPLKLISAFLLSMIIGLSLILYSYTLLNLMHSIFIKVKNPKKTLRMAFSKSFKIRTYKLYLKNLKILLVFGVIILIIYLFFKVFIFISFQDYLKYYGYYRYILISVLVIGAYFLILFNRLNFYLMSEKK